MCSNGILGGDNSCLWIILILLVILFCCGGNNSGLSPFGDNGLCR
jgi:hypothetical protein